MDKWQGKNDQEIFREQIFIISNVTFLLRSEKRTNFLHMRDHVVDSACLNRCLLELTARKLRKFELKIFKLLKLDGFKIKIFYWTIYF